MSRAYDRYDLAAATGILALADKDQQAWEDAWADLPILEMPTFARASLCLAWALLSDTLGPVEARFQLRQIQAAIELRAGGLPA